MKVSTFRAARAAFAGFAVFACGLAGCGGSSDDPAGSSVGSLYVAIIGHLDIPTADEANERTVVHVADLNAEPLSLDDQFTVIDELDDQYDVRFVDQLEAIIEFSDDDTIVPPPDGPLVAIGTPIDADGDVVVRVEMTGDGAVIDAWQLVLQTGDVASVIETSEIEPELLVPAVAP